MMKPIFMTYACSGYKEEQNLTSSVNKFVGIFYNFIKTLWFIIIIIIFIIIVVSFPGLKPKVAISFSAVRPKCWNQRLESGSLRYVVLLLIKSHCEWEGMKVLAPAHVQPPTWRVKVFLSRCPSLSHYVKAIHMVVNLGPTMKYFFILN